MKTADGAWLALGASVLTYELFADDLLSYGCDRYLEARPGLTRSIIVITAAHLCNWLPPQLDPYTGFGQFILRMKGRNVAR